MAILKSGDGGGKGALPGCTLMGAALGMFALVIGISIWSFVSQDRAISKFTQDEAEETRTEEGTEAEIASLRAKLDGFSKREASGETAELELTVRDLNLIVATTDAGKDYRGMVYFTGTRELAEGRENEEMPLQDRQLVGDVCMTMNKLKFWEKRYLVGEMEFDLRPVVAGLDLIITGVSVPGKEVPGQFVGTFVNWHWLAPFHDDPALKPVLGAIKEVEVLEDRVVLRTEKTSK